MEHWSTVCACEVTPAGHAQWAEANEQFRAGNKVCLGWSHSHHQVRLIPTREPSATDVCMQYHLQNQFPFAKLMLIFNEESWSAWTLPHASMELLKQHGCNMTALQATTSPLALVQPATFLQWDSGMLRPEVRIEGHSLTGTIQPPPMQSQQSPLGCCPKCHAKRRGPFCGQCGEKLTDARPISLQWCSTCKASRKRPILLRVRGQADPASCHRGKFGKGVRH